MSRFQTSLHRSNDVLPPLTQSRIHVRGAYVPFKIAVLEIGTANSERSNGDLAAVSPNRASEKFHAGKERAFVAYPVTPILFLITVVLERFVSEMQRARLEPAAPVYSCVDEVSVSTEANVRNDGELII